MQCIKRGSVFFYLFPPKGKRSVKWPTGRRWVCVYFLFFSLFSLPGCQAGHREAPAPCGFQLARVAGKALDGELLLLQSRTGPVTSSDKRRHPCRDRAFPPARPKLKAEFRRSLPVSCLARVTVPCSLLILALTLVPDVSKRFNRLQTLPRRHELVIVILELHQVDGIICSIDTKWYNAKSICGFRK